MPGPRRSPGLPIALALAVALVAGGVPGAIVARDLGNPSAVTTGVIAQTVVSSSIARPVVAAVVPPVDATATRPWVSRPTVAVPIVKAESESRNATARGTSGTAYRGTNHVWIPALGVDRSVSFFSCSSSAYPGDRVYRWGCAGSNNVYLFGHAHSVFRPLHDAYVRGRLAKGMKVYYADGNGRVSTYAVSWWRVTTPDKGEFAYAAQSRPSLTLQTCVGANSQYRLIVRLTKVG